MALGDFAKMTEEERVSWYRGHPCFPTPDESADWLDRVAWLRKEHQEIPFRSFLDIACHDGFTSRWLLREPGFNFLVGLDPCVAAIEAAGKLVRELNYPDKAIYLALGFEEIDFTTLFDGVSLFETLEHFTSEQASNAIKFVYDHLRHDGGRAYFCTPRIDGVWGAANPDPAHINLFDKDHLYDTIKFSLPVSPREADLIVFQKGEFIYAKFSRTEGSSLARRVGLSVPSVGAV